MNTEPSSTAASPCPRVGGVQATPASETAPSTCCDVERTEHEFSSSESVQVVHTVDGGLDDEEGERQREEE